MLSNRKLKGVMGVCVPLVSSICSSQVSYAGIKTWTDGNVQYRLNERLLLIRGNEQNGRIDRRSIFEHLTEEEMRNISRIYIGKGITNIGDHAFAFLGDLEYIHISNSVKTIEVGVFACCKFLKNITIPNSVTTIGDFVFSGCKSLKKITLPSHLEAIGEGTFDGCESLKNINIPNSVTSIGDTAFRSCESLEEITLSSNLETIGDNAFQSCESLKNINIPNSVITIGKNAFEECNNLKTVIFEDMARGSEYCKFSCSEIRICKNTFKDCKSLMLFSTGNRTVHFDVDSFNGCIQLFRQYENTAFRGWIRTNYYLSRYLISS